MNTQPLEKRSKTGSIRELDLQWSHHIINKHNLKQSYQKLKSTKSEGHVPYSFLVIRLLNYTKKKPG